MTKVHFLGIAGSGASAAAAIAQAQGYEVTGCDLEPNNEFTGIFQSNQLLKGHNPKHLDNVDILAVSPAIFSLDPNNPELLTAKEKSIPVLTWQQFTGEYLAKDKYVIAVCGTHGKTTTTAMIAQLLEDAGLDPTVLLGAIVPKWKANFRLPRQTSHGRRYFVLEADEFNDNFLSHKPEITVVTNIEMDHPEYFKDINALLDSFEKFLLQTKQTIVANLTDPNVSEILKDVMKQTSVTAVDFTKNEIGFNLQIPGNHNVLNAKAAMQVGILLGITPDTIRQSLSSYQGVGRRFEYIGEFSGAKVYSDFGHHPTEIKVTMEAARQKFPDQRIILVYQPHMFSRTKALFNDFIKVFKEIPVDKIIITDIYPSREMDTGIVSSKELAEATNYDRLEYHSKGNLLPLLKQQTLKEDIVFFMGAGDIDKLAKLLVSGS